MSYISIDDIQKEFPDRDVPKGADDSVDLDKVNRAIDRAQATADGYLRSAMLSVPLTGTDAIAQVKGPCLDLWRYFAWNEHASEEVRERYKDAIRFFESVAAGKIRIIDTDTNENRKSGFHNVLLIRS